VERIDDRQHELKETLLQSLEQRDSRELLASDVYAAYAKLAGLYSTLRTEGSLGITSAASSSKSQTDDTNTLKSQIAELYKTQNTHLQTIKSLETGLTSLQTAEKQLKQELSDLRARRRDLELRAALHGETLREKNHQIQILQDELLTTGISLSVLEERAAKVEEENKSLLERWMVRIKAEAEKMNDANEFLEGIRGMRLESPGPGEEPSDEKEDIVS